MERMHWRVLQLVRRYLLCVVYGDMFDECVVFLQTTAMVSVEGLRMMTWQEKLQMLTSVENIVGKSQLLEKEYLRLCGPPDPALVRPEHVLKQSFSYCLEKWESGKNYRFIEEQFRSIRQDLMVQGIKNSFTVLVYETNAKIALKNLDLGQFNQCQTQLHELYKQLAFDIKAKEEFLCYRILYLTLTNMNHDLLKLLGKLFFFY
jgi:SAC3 family protein LENG8/THP3